MAKIIIYSEKDYLGSHNILRSEKRLLIRAYLKSSGDVGEMSKMLEISEKVMLLKLISHFGSFC
jgi:hypothetical protein